MPFCKGFFLSSIFSLFLHVFDSWCVCLITPCYLHFWLTSCLFFNDLIDALGLRHATQSRKCKWLKGFESKLVMLIQGFCPGILPPLPAKNLGSHLYLVGIPTFGCLLPREYYYHLLQLERKVIINLKLNKNVNNVPHIHISCLLAFQHIRGARKGT